MTPEMAKRWLPIIQAVAEGKTVQVFDHATSVWMDAAESWNSLGNCPDAVRIKPEIREFWVVDQQGIIQVHSLKSSAVAAARTYPPSCPFKIIHVREVIDE